MSLMCKTISDYPSSTGAMPLLYSLRDCIPYAFEGLMFSIFLILFAAQYFLIKNRTGRARIFVALLASSFFSIVLSMMLTLAQLIKYPSVILYAFLTILSFAVLIISDES